MFVNWILGLVFLTGFLLLIQYIRSSEGFANPIPVMYEYEPIFQNWPLEKICNYWIQEYQKIVKSFTLDDLGKPVPEDIAKRNADLFLKSYLPTGPLPCPVEFPKTNDIETVARFIKDIDPMLLAKAYMTLFFITGQSRLALANLKKSMNSIPKPQAEAFENLFLTECSPTELLYRNTVPLQCVDPVTQKATDKEIISKQDPDETKRIAKLREQLSLGLATLQKNVVDFHTSFIENTNMSLNNLSKTIAQLQSAKKLLEDTKSEDEGKIKQVSEALSKATSERDRFTLYKQIMNMKPNELIADYEKNIEEAKKVQQKLESGDFSNL